MLTVTFIVCLLCVKRLSGEAEAGLPPRMVCVSMNTCTSSGYT